MTAQNVSRVHFEIEADYRLHNPDNGTSTVVTGRQKVDFKLGLGPCKRWVSELTMEVTISTLTITQTSYSEDPEVYRKEYDIALAEYFRHNGLGGQKVHGMSMFHEKDCKVEHFIYKWDDVRGRVRAE